MQILPAETPVAGWQSSTALKPADYPPNYSSLRCEKCLGRTGRSVFFLLFAFCCRQKKTRAQTSDAKRQGATRRSWAKCSKAKSAFVRIIGVRERLSLGKEKKKRSEMGLHLMQISLAPGQRRQRELLPGYTRSTSKKSRQLPARRE